MNTETAISSEENPLPASPWIWALLLLIVIILYELIFILILNTGTFAYTLDDAYIHLSLSSNIAHGHYGINIIENSSPASSILWPFLLAPFAFFPFHYLVPLIINIAAAIATIFFMAKIFDILFSGMDERPKIIFITAMLCILIPGINLAGLIFTGMEHSLQVLLVVIFFLGIVKEQRGFYSATTWIVLLILLPLVRYEDLAISMSGITYLFFRGHKRDAVIAFILTGILLGGFSLFLFSLGLSPIPASILDKTRNFYADQNPFMRILGMASISRGILFVIPMLILVLLSLYRDLPKEQRLLIACASGAIALHLAYGQIGYYSRYEIYMWIFTLLTLITLFRHGIQAIFSSAKITFLVIIVLAEIMFCPPYNMVLVTTPYASNNIYEQHFQLRKFLVDFYKKPVAVNDIGYISYRNKNIYILDLWGLTSTDVGRIRKTNTDSGEWMQNLSLQHSVELAIIYDSWFPQRPVGWKKIAELSLSRTPITAGGPVVSFFAMNAKTIHETLPKLIEFEKTLPVRSMMKIFPAQ